MSIEIPMSRRLENFMDNHLGYEDIGSPESGQMLDSFYNGPTWVDDVLCPFDPGYWYHLEYANHEWWNYNVEKNVVIDRT